MRRFFLLTALLLACGKSGPKQDLSNGVGGNQHPNTPSGGGTNPTDRLGSTPFAAYDGTTPVRVEVSNPSIPVTGTVTVANPTPLTVSGSVQISNPSPVAVSGTVQVASGVIKTADFELGNLNAGVSRCASGSPTKILDGPFVVTSVVASPGSIWEDSSATLFTSPDSDCRYSSDNREVLSIESRNHRPVGSTVDYHFHSESCPGLRIPVRSGSFFCCSGSLSAYRISWSGFTP